MTINPYDEEERVDFSRAVFREAKLKELGSMLLNDSEIQESNKVRTGWPVQLGEGANTDSNNTASNSLNNSRSNSQLITFDVLPSFELYRSVQSCGCSEMDIADDNDDIGELPPDYSTPSSSSYISSSEGVSTATDDAFRFNAPVTASTSNSSANSTATTTFNENVPVNVLDSCHNLPLENSPAIRLDIFVTKDVPDPNQKQDQESVLKEYTSGDLVHGYVIIHNVSDKAIKFQNFIVSLEGVTTIVDPHSKKQIRKKFLNMIDISSSWSPGCIFPSSNMKLFTPGEIDFEHCVFNLTKDRILQPRTKYKKFFTFKFPYTLLDTTCRHDQEVHLLLPPSLGIDYLKESNRQHGEIKVDPLLNYGHNYTRGSPVVTNDLSSKETSIEYSINAKLIVQKRNKVVRLKEKSYNLRFIPFGFITPIFSSKNSYNKLCELIEKRLDLLREDLKFQNSLKSSASSKSPAEIEAEINDFNTLRKSKQLIINSSISGKNSLRNESSPLNVETKFNVTLNSNSGNGSFLFRKNNSLKNGLIVVSSSIPKVGLQYISPSLIQKTNTISKLNQIGLDNYDNLSSNLSTKEKELLNKINLNLTFRSSDGDGDISPPEIKEIKVKLQVISSHSTGSIPIKLSSDLLLLSSDKQTINKKFKSYSDEITSLKEMYKKMDLDRNFNQIVDKRTIADIEAMKNLNIRTSIIQIFKSSVNQAESTQWVKSNTTNNHEFKRSLVIDVELNRLIKETIIPTFQSCLLSRQYCIQVEIKFKNAQSVVGTGCASTCVLNIPIRVRNIEE